MSGVLLLAAALLAQVPEVLQPVPALRARPLQGLRADAAALLLSGREMGALRALVLAAPFPADGDDEPNVAIWVEIDGASLLPPGTAGEDESTDGSTAADAGAPKSLRLELHVYAMSKSGALAGSLSETVRIPLEELGDDLLLGGVKYSAGLRVKPGDHELRVLLRDTGSQRFVVRHQAITVPAADDPAPAVHPPFFADVEGAWIEVRGANVPRAAAELAPSALPVLAAGRELTARFWLSGADSKRPTLRLLDGERRKKAEIALRAAGPAAAPPSAFRALDVLLELPADLATGNYTLEAALGDARSTLQVYVLGLERDERALVWTDVQRLSAGTRSRREALELAAQRRASKRIDTVARAYAEVLERLASGRVDEARDELARLEQEVMASDETEGHGWLESAEDQVQRSLAEADAESLVPVLYLHMGQYERYRAQERRALAVHSRERAIAVARLYGATSRSELAPSMAAAALADMGLALRRARLRLGARRMMEQALALDPRNTTALLVLALERERHGDYPLAMDALRRLLEIDPRSEEGRLRLALNLRRTGQLAEASRLLRRVVDDGETEWLVVLAYQELGRILLAADRPDRAVRLLRAAVRRLPSQQRLYVQLAFALDRAGENRKARDVLARAPGGSPQPSPRWLYSRLTLDETASRREELVRHSMARLSTLALALSRSEAKR